MAAGNRGSAAAEPAEHQDDGDQNGHSSSSDAEQGEIPASEDDEHLDSHKRKHAPIVWEPVKKPARAAGVASQNLLDRAVEEAAIFKQMQLEAGIDPDAPAAMKSSPSCSGMTSAPS